jgi:hypothetical protein
MPQGSGNDFSGAELIDCSVRGGVRLGANQWPSGPEYLSVAQAQQRLKSVRAEVHTWPETPTRERALIWLDFHAEWGYDEQEELILRRVEIAPGLNALLVNPDMNEGDGWVNWSGLATAAGSLGAEMVRVLDKLYRAIGGGHAT